MSFCRNGRNSLIALNSRGISKEVSQNSIAGFRRRSTKCRRPGNNFKKIEKRRQRISAEKLRKRFEHSVLKKRLLKLKSDLKRSRQPAAEIVDFCFRQMRDRSWRRSIKSLRAERSHG